MTMKEQYQTAIAYAKAGEYVKAYKLASKIDHPKAKQLKARLGRKAQVKRYVSNRLYKRIALTFALLVVALFLIVVALGIIQDARIDACIDECGGTLYCIEKCVDANY